MRTAASMVVGIYLLFFLFRKKLHSRGMQRWMHQERRIPTALLLQPYTFLMTSFTLLYVCLLCSFVHLLSKYSLLDPSTFRLPECAQQNADYAIPHFVRMLAVISPAVIGLTWIVTIFHWHKHLPLNRGFDEDLRWYPSFSHDLAMQVVALPLVYSIFALDSVLEMLGLLTGDVMRHIPEQALREDCSGQWAKVMSLAEQTTQTNTQLADLYEAWALRCFGQLCFMLVRRQINREVPTVKYILSTIKSHLDRVATAGSTDRGIMEDVKILTDPRKQLFEPLQQTSRIGVRVFVWTYGLKSMYLLVLTLLSNVDVHLCDDHAVFKPVCSFRPYLDGACFLASTLAIYNIVVFEQNLKSILEVGKFKPFEKFLGVKLMVSIAFMQSFALEVIGSWAFALSDQQISLLYPCLLCFEVLPLSLLLYVAWRPTEGDWHNFDRYGTFPEPSALAGDGAAPLVSSDCHGQLADEASSATDENHEFQRSRELSATLGTRPAFSDELTGIIELRGEVEAGQAKAIEDVINNLSRRIRAQYKPAALFRTVRSTGPGSQPPTQTY